MLELALMYMISDVLVEVRADLTKQNFIVFLLFEKKKED